MKPEYRMMEVKEEESATWFERFVLHSHLDGSCIAVMDTSMIEFEKEGVFNTLRWAFCREIPVPKTRFMTRDEIVLFVCTTPNIAVRFKGCAWTPPGRYYGGGSVKEFEWCECTSTNFGEPQLFLVHEEK